MSRKWLEEENDYLKSDVIERDLHIKKLRGWLDHISGILLRDDLSLEYKLGHVAATIKQYQRAENFGSREVRGD